MKIKKIEINLRAKISPKKEALNKHIKSPFFRDTVTQLLLIPSVFLLLAGWILAIYYFSASEYMIPLRYNSFMGVLALGKWYDIYIIPLVLTTCFLVNVVLANTIYQKDKFLGYILVATNIFLTLVAMVVIINFGKISTL